VHDISPDFAFFPNGWEEQYEIARKGAFPALSKMRDEGIIRAWGIGVNTPLPILRAALITALPIAHRWSQLQRVAVNMLPLSYRTAGRIYPFPAIDRGKNETHPSDHHRLGHAIRLHITLALTWAYFRAERRARRHEAQRAADWLISSLETAIINNSTCGHGGQTYDGICRRRRPLLVLLRSTTTDHFRAFVPVPTYDVVLRCLRLFESGFRLFGNVSRSNFYSFHSSLWQSTVEEPGWKSITLR
jgi:hypothetical protein